VTSKLWLQRAQLPVMAVPGCVALCHGRRCAAAPIIPCIEGVARQRVQLDYQRPCGCFLSRTVRPSLKHVETSG
jgi:hypothetical protein